MKDLDTAKAEFWAAVKDHAPDDFERLKPVLEDLIEWSKQQPELHFVWHKGKPGRKRQFLVKYCYRDTVSPFWAVWPRKGDGAKLTVLTDADAFPEALRREAREELARLDVSSSGEAPGDNPDVSLMALIPRASRQKVLNLMSRLLHRLEGDKGSGLR